MNEIKDYYDLPFKLIPCNLQDDFNRLNDYVIKQFGSWENYKKESISISEDFMKNFNPRDWFMIFGEECNQGECSGVFEQPSHRIKPSSKTSLQTS